MERMTGGCGKMRGRLPGRQRAAFAVFAASRLLVGSLVLACGLAAPVVADTGFLPRTPPPKPPLADGATIQRFVDGVASREVILVAQAIGWALEGIADPELMAPVAFAAGAVPPADPTLRDGGFRIRNFTITEVLSAPVAPRLRQASGLLLHRDPFGRTIATGFRALFFVAGGGPITVFRAATTPISPTVPEIALHVVPASAAPPDLLSNPKSAELLDFAIKHAVTPADVRRLKGKKQDFVVFAFATSRVSADARLDLVVGRRNDITAKRTTIGSSFREHGWPVAWQRATFALGGQPEVLMVVLYTSGDTERDGRPEPTIARIISSQLAEATQVRTSGRTAR